MSNTNQNESPEEGLVSLNDLFAECEEAFTDDEVRVDNSEGLEESDRVFKRPEDVEFRPDDPEFNALETARFLLEDVKALLLVKSDFFGVPKGSWGEVERARETLDNVDHARTFDTRGRQETRAGDYAPFWVEDDYLSPAMVANAAVLLAFAKTLIKPEWMPLFEGPLRNFDRLLAVKAKSLGVDLTNPKFTQLRGYELMQPAPRPTWERKINTGKIKKI